MGRDWKAVGQKVCGKPKGRKYMIEHPLILVGLVLLALGWGYIGFSVLEVKVKGRKKK